MDGIFDLFNAGEQEILYARDSSFVVSKVIQKDYKVTICLREK